MTRNAIIVAHGQPSDPDPAEADMAALATATAAGLPGWTLRAATLAAPGRLAEALHGMDDPLVFPFFMADGWFTRTLLPRRLAEAGAAKARILSPFGLMPEATELARRIATEAAALRGWPERTTTLVLAAHGSGRSPMPATAARTMQDAIAERTSFADIRLGFIEEPPHLPEAAARAGSRALCLPLFVARWGHVIGDIPEGLARAGFGGALLNPLGTHPDVPAMIAGALRQGAEGAPISA